MKPLLPLSRFIDALSERIGHLIYWLVLAAVVISALNAVVRKAFNVGSNSFLEIQWYLFAAIFLLCAGYTFLRNEHVRIDVLTSRLPPRGRAWVDVIGIVAFLLPMAIGLTLLGWPQFVLSYQGQEMSSNAGGLIRWPAKLLIPVGFALLAMQGVSELIKRLAFLQGLIEDPTKRKQQKTAEEELAEAIRAQAEGALK